MGNHLSCDAVDMRDTVTRYVSGHLTEEEAGDFEQHLESCERCWGEVQMALQVRATTRTAGERASEPPRRSILRRHGWLAAVAASAVVLIAGWWFVVQRQTPPEMLRGGNSIAIAASHLPDGGIRLSWPAVDGASSYRITVSQVDGTPFVTRDINRPELTLTPADLPAPIPASLILELRAEDALGTPLVVHGPVVVPVSGANPLH